MSKNSYHLPQQRREATYKRAFRSFSAFLSASLPSIFIVNIPLRHPRNLLPPSNSGLPRSVAFPSAPSLGAVPALCGHGAAGSAAPAVMAMGGKRKKEKNISKPLAQKLYRAFCQSSAIANGKERLRNCCCDAYAVTLRPVMTAAGIIRRLIVILKAMGLKPLAFVSHPLV
ncbi:hypothetical protein [Acidibrevibacterium fodinaquatile]|uniref:hypothetical protein n=1 Tax=Acidibrevibacterium fodinaquatile TaxID=1969806 RepID=UPI0013B45846|nr:hypothetical protein [Acidibrevibacterium fodinaquatile]